MGDVSARDKYALKQCVIALMLGFCITFSVVSIQDNANSNITYNGSRRITEQPQYEFGKNLDKFCGCMQVSDKEHFSGFEKNKFKDRKKHCPFWEIVLFFYC